MCQFEDIGSHGTKVILYNLWLNDEGIYELSFDDDDEVCFYLYGGLWNAISFAEFLRSVGVCVCVWKLEVVILNGWKLWRVLNF